MGRNTAFLIYSFLLFLCLATVWQLLSLNEVPVTPNNDLARHVATIENFRLALLSGQWIPRLQLAPALTPDIPLFQFYGFMTGLLSLPFLGMGVRPLRALVLAVLAVRWFGVVAIFQTGRMLGANLWTSLLASTSYLLTPYIISNLYGRVAIPEAIAHGIIACLLYGLVRFATRADAISVVTICISVVALALTHPIFLVYGCVASALFVVLVLKPRMILLGGLILAGSLLVASFQWYPGFAMRDSFVASFIWYSPYDRAELTSFSGLYGFPLSVADTGLGDETWLFLTPGILTIPVLVLLIMKIGNRFARATLCCLASFLVLSFPPFDFWKFAPDLFSAVQFPYRLLAFVALFAALGICLTLKQLKPYQFIVLALLLLGQSFGLLVQPPYSAALPVKESEIAERFASMDYIIRPLGALVSGDGWLQHYALPVVATGLKNDQVVNSEGYLFKDNAFYVGTPPRGENYLRITGVIENGNSPVQLWIAYPENSQVPLDGQKTVERGHFSVIFRLPDNIRRLTIRYSHGRELPSIPETKGQSINVRLDAIELLPGHRIRVRGSPSKPSYLSIIGSTIFTDGPVELWIAHITTPDVPVSDKVSVGPGPFITRLRLPDEPGDYVLVPSRYLVPVLVDPRNPDTRRLSIRIKAYMETSANESVNELWISATQVERSFSYGYKREFQIKAASVGGIGRPENSPVLVELPIAYSPLTQIIQGHYVLPAQPTEAGLASVRTSDLKTLIVARFRLPWPVWPAMALGFCILAITVYRLRRLRPADPALSGNGPSRF